MHRIFVAMAWFIIATLFQCYFLSVKFKLIFKIKEKKNSTFQINVKCITSVHTHAHTHQTKKREEKLLLTNERLYIETKKKPFLRNRLRCSANSCRNGCKNCHWSKWNQIFFLIFARNSIGYVQSEITFHKALTDIRALGANLYIVWLLSSICSISQLNNGDNLIWRNKSTKPSASNGYVMNGMLVVDSLYR